jgi:ribosomal protein S21
MINVQIEKNPNESSINMIKRFTKRVQSAGVLRKVRSNRYKSRTPSEYTKKKHTLAALGRQIETQRLIKLGKIIEKAPRR